MPCKARQKLHAESLESSGSVVLQLWTWPACHDRCECTGCTGLVCYCVGIGEYCCCGFNMIHVFSVAGPTCQDEACPGRAAPRNRGRRRGCPEGCRQGCMQLLREALRLRLGLPELVLGPLRLRTERSAPRSVVVGRAWSCWSSAAGCSCSQKVVMNSWYSSSEMRSFIGCVHRYSDAASSPSRFHPPRGEGAAYDIIMIMFIII
jgi:hypothetical protein